MSQPPNFRDLDRFTKAKGLPRISKVAGGLRGVYLNPDRVQVFDGKDINGSRGGHSSQDSPRSPSSNEASAPSAEDSAS